MIPPRNPNAAPHVEPETFNIAGSIGIHEIIASAIPACPNSDDCFSCIILITTANYPPVTNLLLFNVFLCTPYYG